MISLHLALILCWPEASAGGANTLSLRLREFIICMRWQLSGRQVRASFARLSIVLLYDLQLIWRLWSNVLSHHNARQAIVSSEQVNSNLLSCFMNCFLASNSCLIWSICGCCLSAISNSTLMLSHSSPLPCCNWQTIKPNI